MDSSAPLELQQRIEVIESGYEFMLAYAAQGFESTQQSTQTHDIRVHLASMDEALNDLSVLVNEVARHTDGGDAATYQAFVDALSGDAEKAQGAIRLVLARPGMSSQLIDNLNASIHLRALLTDLFLLDEAFKP